MTALTDSLRETILIDGPISVERYMALCLAHYYGTRDPFGAAGDFTTAPEISQMFGELIGLWMAEVWRLMGGPQRVNWVELGPGRGTLSSDALRAAKLVPSFLEAIDVRFVETSPLLREKQRQAFENSGHALNWYNSISDLPNDEPLFVIANEFFDALPVQQYVAFEGEWRQRCVGLDDHDQSLQFGLFPSKGISLALPPVEGEMLEVPLAGSMLMHDLTQRIVRQGGVALIIDYGYGPPSYGDTLQALQHHIPVDALANPGDADLTTHVCFQHLADVAQSCGGIVHGLATQGTFLEQIGIGMRAASLMKAAPMEADMIHLALARLTERGPRGMGDLFKVMAVSSPVLRDVPALPRCGSGRLHI